MSAPLLRVAALRKAFPVGAGWFGANRRLRAVDGVDLELRAGETLGVVGESGCGKSTLARLILRLIAPDTGAVEFQGRDLSGLSRRELRGLRRHMQIVFQDPQASLNPRIAVGDAIGEGLHIHGIGDPGRRRERVGELLEIVGLRRDHAERYPHEFSGGQRQRIGIARALAVEPLLLIGDEPISSLDVSIQAQILNLLLDLQERFGLAYLFISHDLRVVRHLADRIAVMYLGRFVEVGASEELHARPQHPYTEALQSAVPLPDPARRRERIALRGDVPSPIDPPGGCPFHPRCPQAIARCAREVPLLREVRPGQFSACHLAPF